MKKIFGSFLLCLLTILLIANISYSAAYSEFVISTPGYNIKNYDLNDNGHVVWTENDGNDDEIYFYDGSTSQLTFNALTEKFPKINNNDQLVWEVYDVRFGYLIELDNPYDSLDPITINQVNWDYPLL